MHLPLRHLLLLAFTTLLADQGAKYLAVSHLTSALEGREGLAARVVGFYTLHNLDNAPPVPGGVDRVADRRVEVVGGVWHHRYVENEGRAAGPLAGLPEALRQPLQHASALLALLFLLWWGARLPAVQRPVARALGLVLGGAVGNFADRLLRGYVIDFIDWHWGQGPALQWPTFNLADVAIFSGVSLLVLEALAVGRGSAARPEAPPVLRGV